VFLIPNEKKRNGKNLLLANYAIASFLKSYSFPGTFLRILQQILDESVQIETPNLKFPEIYKALKFVS
jgi:hypothetical protein